MRPEKIKIPVSALHLSEREKGTVDADGRGQVNILAYSGGIIRNHFYWGELGIDLQGLSLSKDRYPILENHRVERKVGHFTRSQVRVNGGLRIVGGTLLDTDAAREFHRLSGQGFPYEASIYAVPSEVERLEKNQPAQVNGLTMQGPGTIWRACTLREVSVCVFGFDPGTRAEALSHDRNALSLDVMVRGTEIDEDQRWVNHMLGLVGQQPKGPTSDRNGLTHNERMIRDFMNGEGIFAE